VGGLNAVLRTFVSVLLTPLAGHPILWSLLLVSALSALLGLLIFESSSNKTVRDRAERRLWANLLAIRLFADDPQIVLQSLAGVVVANGRLLLCALPPLTLLVPLFLLLYGHLDAFFGSPPIPVNVPQVLTVRLNDLEHGWPDIQILTPSWIRVDSPPVHVLDEKTVSWTIRATQASYGELKIVMAKESVGKTIDSRPGPRYFSLARRQSLAGSLRYPAEGRLPPGPIGEVNIIEPAPVISCFGLALDWTWWFAILSVLFAIPAKRLRKC
jgi:hypothetical protein